MLVAFDPKDVLRAQKLALNPELRKAFKQVVLTGSASDREHLLMRTAERFGSQQGFLVGGLLFASQLEQASAVPGRSRGGRRHYGIRSLEEAYQFFVQQTITHFGERFAKEVFGPSLQERPAVNELSMVRRKLATKLHTDKKGGDNEKMTNLNLAWGLLQPQKSNNSREPELTPAQKAAAAAAQKAKEEEFLRTSKLNFQNLEQRQQLLYNVSIAVGGLILAGVIATAVYKLWWKPRQLRRERERLQAFAPHPAKAKDVSLERISDPATELTSAGAMHAQLPSSTPERPVPIRSKTRYRHATAPTFVATRVLGRRKRRPLQTQKRHTSRHAQGSQLRKQKVSPASHGPVRHGGGIRKPPDAAQEQMAAIIDAATVRVTGAAASLHVNPDLLRMNTEAASDTAAALRSSNPGPRLKSIIEHATRQLWAWTRAVGRAAWGVVRSAGRRLWA